MVGDGTHGEVVGDNDTGETKLVSEQFVDYGRGERGGEVVAEGAVNDMIHHDHVDTAGGDKVAVGLQFAFLPGGGDIDKACVGVAGGTSMSGEVFKAGDDV